MEEWRGSAFRGWRGHSFLPLPGTEGREGAASLVETRKVYRASRGPDMEVKVFPLPGTGQKVHPLLRTD